MKRLYNFSTLLLLLFSELTYGQEVTTFTTVTANGGVTVDQEGNILAAHFGPLPPNPAIGKNIYKITLDGTVSLFVDGELNVGSGNDIDSQGFLYQSNFSTGIIYKINPDGDVVDNNFATVAGPVGIAIDPNDTLYVCSCAENLIHKISPDGNKSTFASGNTFNCANGITMDDEGNLYISNFSDGRITKVTPDGMAQNIGSTPVGNGHLTFRSQDQMLYIASYTGHIIYKMDLDGNVEPFAGTGSPGTMDATDPMAATFLKPNGITLSNDGCVLYISQDEDVIRAILFNDGQCLTNSTDLDKPSEFNIFPNPVKDNIYINNKSNTRISTFKIIDGLGKTVLNLRMEDIQCIDVSHLPSGMYSLFLIDENGKESSEMIIIER